MADARAGFGALTVLTAFTAFALGTTGCDVHTDDGKGSKVDLKAPTPSKYDVKITKTEEGQAGHIDLHEAPGPDSGAKTSKVEITLPKLPKYDVTVKETEKGRPGSIDVKPADDGTKSANP